MNSDHVLFQVGGIFEVGAGGSEAVEAGAGDVSIDHPENLSEEDTGELTQRRRRTSSRSSRRTGSSGGCPRPSGTVIRGKRKSATHA